MLFRESLGKYVRNQSKARLTISVFIGMILMGILFQNCGPISIQSKSQKSSLDTLGQYVTASFLVNGQKHVTVQAGKNTANQFC